MIDFVFINTVLFWFGTIVIVYHAPLITRYIYTKIFCKGMSNMRTAPEIGAKVAEIITADMASKGNPKDYTVLDLGSAYGYYSCQLAELLPQVKVIGMDCDPGGVAFSKAMAKRKKLSNVEFIKCDFFNYDISKADAIVFYLPDYLMQPMGELLKTAPKNGALIISNRFQLEAGWEPMDVLQIETTFNRQGRLNIYRC
jgi:protein-L-isoaspartate O-methyltransferase